MHINESTDIVDEASYDNPTISRLIMFYDLTPTIFSGCIYFLINGV